MAHNKSSVSLPSEPQPGFVVWLATTNARIRGFIAWSETGVAELTPFMAEAWKFPSLNAASIAANRALGCTIENCAIAIFPATPN